ncbi:uncharacterized protein [Anoplolepis gracilipes]|uniref:uncharacterized protein n=1 Tax=Anoplolepis gracilipes TaxID=354296 RepID=UPI003BA08B37
MDPEVSLAYENLVNAAPGEGILPPAQSKNLKAHIPAYRISRQGFIRDVPLNVTEIKRKFFHHTKFYQSYLSFMVKYDVNIFVPKVASCFSCLRYRHSSLQCKSFSRCRHCAEKSHGDQVSCPKADLPLLCANYKGPHRTYDSQCPEFLVQRRICELSAIKNVPLSDARAAIRFSRKNPKSNFNFDLSNYPDLGNVSTLDILYFTALSSTFPSSYPLFSYAEVARPLPSSSRLTAPNSNKKNSRTRPTFTLNPSSAHQGTRPSSLLLNSIPCQPSSHHSSSPPTSFFSSPNSLLIAPNGQWPQSSLNGLATIQSHNLNPSSSSPFFCVRKMLYASPKERENFPGVCGTPLIIGVY